MATHRVIRASASIQASTRWLGAVDESSGVRLVVGELAGMTAIPARSLGPQLRPQLRPEASVGASNPDAIDGSIWVADRRPDRARTSCATARRSGSAVRIDRLYWSHRSKIESCMADSPRRTVGIFVFPDVEVLDFAGPFEVFSRTRTEPGPASRQTEVSAPFDVFTVGAERGSHPWRLWHAATDRRTGDPGLDLFGCRIGGACDVGLHGFGSSGRRRPSRRTAGNDSPRSLGSPSPVRSRRSERSSCG